MRQHAQRGAILVESALVVSAIFLLLFGTVYVAIIGFDQMSADGAAYEVAHQAAVGASAPPVAANNVFPNIPVSGITTNPAPAPTPAIPVDYGYNGTTAEQAASHTSRYGGVSMMEPQQVQGQAQKTSATLVGQAITVAGTVIEPLWIENGLHFDAADSDAYGNVGNPTGLNFEGNVFTAGENTPLYYVGFNYMEHCLDAIPWGADEYDLGGGCFTTPTEFIPLGVAEFLDDQNWATTTPGATGSNPGDSTFALAACHQRVYAQIAQFFANNPDLQVIYDTQGDHGGPYPGVNWPANPAYNNDTYQQNYFFAFSANPSSYYQFHLFYNDDPFTETSGPQLAGSNTLKVWAGFDSTLAGEWGFAPLGHTDAAIRQVYSWDGSDVAGLPGAVPNPLHPGAGC